MKLKPYPEYKDSGMEGIGLIPNHWDIIPFKRIINRIKDGTHGTYVRLASGKPLLSAKNVYSTGLKITESESLISEEDFEEITKNGFPKKNDLLLTIVGTIGRSFVYNLDYPLAFQRSVAFIRLKEIFNPYYYFYYTQSELFLDQLISKSKESAQKGVYMGDVVETMVLNVPLSEQQEIVSFLDRKTSEIDLTIEKDTRLIALLKEKRTALINHVVTKGLDPTAEMNDSGVEWIGEIPKDWNFSKIKRYSQILTGGTPSRDIQSYWENGTINWMSSGEINYRRVNLTKEKITSDGLRNSNARILPKKSVMIALNGQGKTKGMVATLNIFTSCNQSLAAFVCDERNIHFNFIYYFLRSKYKDIRGLVGINEREGLSLAVIKDIFVPVPPFKTQIEIANYLDKKTSKIDKTINKIQKNITLLDEYKKSLIHHVVTGKVDVRKVAV